MKVSVSEIKTFVYVNQMDSVSYGRTAFAAITE